MEKFMNEAIKEANKAFKLDEIPVGCVIIKDNKIIAKSHNTKEKDKYSINHAEINCIKKASKIVGDWRLDDCIMYVTLKPCKMCYYAIIESRISKVYYLLDSEYSDKYNKKINVYKYNENDDMSTKYKEKLIEFFKEKR